MGKVVQNKYDVTVNTYNDMFNITNPKDKMFVKVLDASGDTRVLPGSVVMYQYVVELINTNPWIISGTGDGEDIEVILNNGDTFNHNHNLASSTNNGFMSSNDKTKLDNLTNYTLPTASAEVLGGVKVGSGLNISNGVLNATSSNVHSNVMLWGSNVVDSNIDLLNGTNGLIIGPVSVIDGVTITVGDDSRLVIL